LSAEVWLELFFRTLLFWWPDLDRASLLGYLLALYLRRFRSGRFQVVAVEMSYELPVIRSFGSEKWCSVTTLS
jgi:hypothetical protein